MTWQPILALLRPDLTKYSNGSVLLSESYNMLLYAKSNEGLQTLVNAELCAHCASHYVHRDSPWFQSIQVFVLWSLYLS